MFFNYGFLKHLLNAIGTDLAMVGAAVLGHGALAVHQEAVPAALLGQGRLVTLGDEGVQLGLLAADGLHKLFQKHRQTKQQRRTSALGIRAAQKKKKNEKRTNE